MLIGELSAATGVKATTLRFYEDAGLLPPPARTPAGYRVYDASAVSRVRFIRAAQRAGLSLAQIRGVLEVRDSGRAPCRQVEALLTAQLDEVRRRRRELLELERVIERLLDGGARLDPADCRPETICQILDPGT